MKGYDYCIYSFANFPFPQSHKFVANCRLEGSVLGSAERDMANAEPSKSEPHIQGAVQSGMLQVLANFPQRAIGAASCMKSCTYRTFALLSLQTMLAAGLCSLRTA